MQYLGTVYTWLKFRYIYTESTMGEVGNRATFQSTKTTS